jgi:hypothetical protein
VTCDKCEAGTTAKVSESVIQMLVGQDAGWVRVTVLSASQGSMRLRIRDTVAALGSPVLMARETST